MGLEQIAMAFLFSKFIDFIVDFTDDEIGYFVTLFLTCIGLGICLTYILYMNGMV